MKKTLPKFIAKIIACALFFRSTNLLFTNPKKIILTLLFCLCLMGANAQTTYYWVGGSGTWGTSASFAASSGGTGSVLNPAATDIVVFDSKSGTQPITVTIGAAKTVADIQFGCNVTISSSTFTLTTTTATITSSTVTSTGLFTIKSGLTFSGTSPVLNQAAALTTSNTLTLGNGNAAFALTDNSSSTYSIEYNANAAITFNTSSTLNPVIFNRSGATAAMATFSVSKGDITIVTPHTNGLRTVRFVDSASPSVLRIGANSIFEIGSASGSSTLNTTAACGIDASNPTSIMRITSKDVSVLNAKKLFVTSSTVNQLEIVDVRAAFVPYEAMTIKNLVLSGGCFNASKSTTITGSITFSSNGHLINGQNLLTLADGVTINKSGAGTILGGTNGVSLAGISITPGSGYTTSAPTVVVGTQWTSGMTVNTGDQIVSSSNLYTVTTGGTMNTTTPTFIGGSATFGTATIAWAGVAATATASITGNPSGVTGVTLTSAGYGYTTAPTLTFTGGAGSGASVSGVAITALSNGIPTYGGKVDLSYGSISTTQAGSAAINSTSFTLSALNANVLPGMVVTAGVAGIPAGATVFSILANNMPFNLSTNTTAAIAAGTTLTFNSPAVTTGAELSTASAASALRNITINNPAGVTLGSAATASGTLTVNSGSTLDCSTYQLSAATGFAVSNSGSIKTSNTGSTPIPSGYTYGGSVEYANATGGQTIVPGTYSTLLLSNTSGTQSLGGNLTASTLTINNTASLTIAAGNQLTVNTALTNNGTLNLNSTSGGTATILTPATISGSGTVNIQQYLPDARNWYISSPVSGATVPVSGYKFYSRNEPAANWTTMTSDSILKVGRGYIANLASGTATYTFSGTLYSGVKSASLGRTNGVDKAGFNLLGNPYPAHYTVTKAQTDAANALNTIWYRTATWVTDPDPAKSKYVYTFQTCLIYDNGTYLGTPAPTTNIIPPMQSFWVRTNTNNSTFTFNGTTSHQSSNPLKTPAKKDLAQPIARFELSNGIVSDEAIIYSNADATNGFDSYDALKMNNNSTSVPEIYTLVDGTQTVINGMNSIPYDTEIPLGFTTGTAGTFSIKASQIANFDAGTQILLKDNVAFVSRDLSDGSSYVFTSNVSSNNISRFALIFKSSSVATGINSGAGSNIWISVNGANQIVLNGNAAESSVTVYNVIGQKVYAKNLISGNTSLDTPLQSGVYLVSVRSGAKTVSKKVIID